MAGTMEGFTEEYSAFGELYAEAIGDGFLNSISKVFEKIKGAMSMEMDSLNLNGMGTALAGATTNNSTYSPTIILQGEKGATPSEALEAARTQYKTDKIRGLVP